MPAADLTQGDRHRFPATAAEQANLAVADLRSRSSDAAAAGGKDAGGLPCFKFFVVSTGGDGVMPRDY